jgi:hypothetical protein
MGSLKTPQECVEELQARVVTDLAPTMVTTAAFAELQAAMTAGFAELQAAMTTGFAELQDSITSITDRVDTLIDRVDTLTDRVGVLEHPSSAERIIALMHNRVCTGLDYSLEPVPNRSSGEMPQGFPRTLRGKYCNLKLFYVLNFLYFVNVFHILTIFLFPMIFLQH